MKLVQLSPNFLVKMTEEVNIAESLQFTIARVSCHNLLILIQKALEHGFDFIDSLPYKKHLVAAFAFGFNFLNQTIDEL